MSKFLATASLAAACMAVALGLRAMLYPSPRSAHGQVIVSFMQIQIWFDTIYLCYNKNSYENMTSSDK